MITSGTWPYGWGPCSSPASTTWLPTELRKLHGHLLGPLGVAAMPGSLDEALAAYRAARTEWEKRLRREVSPTAERTVMPGLRQLIKDTE